ncbi:antirestriction protein ArdA [Kribbella sp. NPDC056345]|uniref:antirestriction protein ArdA n=1 Tax=Kribbella sp. NPDC056345 TaxID=3345789 RepID=UPI0035D5A365
MSEHQPPPQPNPEAVNTYGTDDPEKQAEIEAARTAAGEERRANREKLERYVGYGLSADDAEGLIEHEQMLKDRRDALVAGDPEQGEADRRSRPHIYIRSVTDHTEGHEIGDWIDASQDLEDIHRDVRSILSRSLHAHWTDQPVEDWEIVNAEGFGGIRIGPNESLDVVCVLGKGITEHGLAFAAWAEIHPQRDTHTLERFTDAYIGDFPDLEAYAQHVVGERGGDEELAKLPEWLQRIMRFDWQVMLQRMQQDGEVHIVEHPGGVWVFNGQG